MSIIKYCGDYKKQKIQTHVAAIAAATSAAAAAAAGVIKEALYAFKTLFC